MFALMVATLIRGAWAAEIAKPGASAAAASGISASDRTKAADASVMPAINLRFAAETKEEPDFRRHISPLLGRLGCNGRACHGSFQGQGGFRLSLFGYDLPADHAAITGSEANRIDRKNPAASLILRKPTMEEDHGGEKRFEKDSWAYRVIHQWIASGAKPAAEHDAKLVHLAVSPAEIVFSSPNATVQLTAVAHWSDGSSEDVTPLCRFRTNDESIAKIDENGLVTSAGPGSTHVVAFYDNSVTPAQVLRPVSELNGDRYPAGPAPTQVDKLVVAQLRKLGIVQSDLSTDADFLRRVSVDITGSLPTPAEVEAFIADASAGKRQRKIEELLASPAYVAWWTTRLCDITGNNPRRAAEQQLGEQQSKQWYAWIERRVRENMPYDKIVAGIVLATSRRPDQSYEEYCAEMSSYFRKDNPADFSQRETMPYFWSRGREGAQAKEKAMSFSYAFLGVRLQCAECHKHPFDQWTKNDFEQFTAFFQPVNYAIPPRDRAAFNNMTKKLTGDLKGGQAQRKISDAVKNGTTVPWREVFVARNPRGQAIAPNRPVKGDKNKKNRLRQRGGRVITPKLLGDEEVQLAAAEDPRSALMDWLRERDNPYFARAFVNRVWAAYFNVGIVEPADDMNLANPPSNAPLLDYLTEGFIASGYDMKWVHRQIANSRTYQLSWRTNDTNRLDERNFSHAVLRRLPAEVAYDALQQATAADAQLVSLRNDFANRAIGPNSTAGRGNPGVFALRVFGKPERATNCDCERVVEPSLLQALFLRNDQDVLKMIDRRDGWMAETAKSLKLPSRSTAEPPTLTDAKGADGKKAKEKKPEKTVKEQTAELRAQIDVLQRRMQRLIAAGETERAQRTRVRAMRLSRELRELLQEDARKNMSAAKPKGAAKEQASKSLDRKQNSDGTKTEAATSVAAKRGKSIEKADAKTAAAAPEPDVGVLIRSLYLRTLSRPPTADEEARVRRHLAANGKAAGLKDTLWALLNSKEFIINH
jgi:hypothetical protein